MTPARHDESTLPKWAQNQLATLRQEVSRLRSLESAHLVLVGREWFTVRASDERFTLFRLSADSATSVCSIAPGDVLLVGRAKRGDA